MSVQGSGSSDEEEPFITPWDPEILHVYNTAMSKLASSFFSGAIQIECKSISELTPVSADPQRPLECNEVHAAHQSTKWTLSEANFHLNSSSFMAMI